MAERGVAKDEIKDCLQRGYFNEQPCISNNLGDINYKFKMRARVESKLLDVVASLYPENQVVVITVFFEI